MFLFRLTNISAECREKLALVKPRTVGHGNATTQYEILTAKEMTIMSSHLRLSNTYTLHCSYTYTYPIEPEVTVTTTIKQQSSETS